MMKLVSKAQRRLGIPGRPAILLDPQSAVEIDERQMSEMLRNRTVHLWMQRRLLVVLDERGNDVTPVEAIGGDSSASESVPKPVLKPRSRKKPALRTDLRPEPELPEGVEGEGVEIHHLGGGWYQVYVNGFKATDKNVRKDEAEAIAKDYD